MLFAVELLGRMVLNAVNLAVVVNYATQCEMILFFVRGLTLRLQEKSTDLRAAMKVNFFTPVPLVRRDMFTTWCLSNF